MLSEDDDNNDVTSHSWAVDYRTPQTVVVLAPQNESPSCGDRVEALWPITNDYYKGSVSEITADGQHVITWEDNDIKTLKISNEKCTYESVINAKICSFTTLAIQ